MAPGDFVMKGNNILEIKDIIQAFGCDMAICELVTDGPGAGTIIIEPCNELKEF